MVFRLIGKYRENYIPSMLYFPAFCSVLFCLLLDHFLVFGVLIYMTAHYQRRNKGSKNGNISGGVLKEEQQIIGMIE